MNVSKQITFIFSLILVACSQSHIQTVSGEKVNFKDKTLVINYWAEWCEPCIKEIPELNKLNALKAVEVVGINFDDLDAKTLKNIKEKMGIDFPLTQEKLNEKFHFDLPVAIPMTVIMTDENSPVILMGPQSYEDLVAKIKPI